MKNILSNLSSLVSAKVENIRLNTQAGKEAANRAAREELANLHSNLEMAKTFQHLAQKKQDEMAIKYNLTRMGLDLAIAVRKDADDLVAQAQANLDNFGA